MSEPGTPNAAQLADLERKLEALRSGVVGPDDETAVEPPLGVIAGLIGDDFPSEHRRRDTSDHLPVPGDANRERYNLGNPGLYWLSGLRDYDTVTAASAVAASGVVGASSSAVRRGGSSGISTARRAATTCGPPT